MKKVITCKHKEEKPQNYIQGLDKPTLNKTGKSRTHLHYDQTNISNLKTTTQEGTMKCLFSIHYDMHMFIQVQAFPLEFLQTQGSYVGQAKF